MILSNRRRYFKGGHCGVIHTAAFTCTVTTSGQSVTVTGSGEDQRKLDELLSEAIPNLNLSDRDIEGVHERILKDLNRYGEAGLDPGGAVEATFAAAKRDGLIVRYENYARILL